MTGTGGDGRPALPSELDPAEESARTAGAPVDPAAGRSRVPGRRGLLLRGSAYAAVALGWAASRAFLVWLTHWSGYPHRIAIIGDPQLYARWAAGLVHGQWPVGDTSWQYPPGAAAVLVVPRLLMPGNYHRGLLVLLLAVDAALTAVLAVRGRDGRLTGVWVWLVGTTALGPLLLNRFDLVPALLAVVGLVLVARPAVAGAVLTVGAIVKVWPVVLLPTIRDPRRAGVGVLASAVVTFAALAVTGSLGAGFTFLHNESARGLQLETVAAVPYLVARAVGVPGIEVVHAYGAYQVVGPGMAVALAATTVATVAVIVGYAVVCWRRRGALRPTGVALATVLTVLVVARVLSPQFLIWVLALAALDAATIGGHRTTGVLLIVIAALTHWLYPLHYHQLVLGHLAPTVVLAVRDALLVAAAVVATRQGMTRPVATR